MSESLRPAISFHIERFDELESTNSTAREWLRAGADEGAVIVAERQTVGRGRQGRSWTSLPGALLFSLILRPRLPPQDIPRLGFYCAAAAALAAEDEGLDQAWLKWPNDLVLPRSGGRWAKWGGILVEAGFDPNPWAIAGVGLNIGTLTCPLPAFGADSLGGVENQPSRPLSQPLPETGRGASKPLSQPLPETGRGASKPLSQPLPETGRGVRPSSSPAAPLTGIEHLNGVEPGSLSDAVGRAIAPESVLRRLLSHFARYYGDGAGGDWKGALEVWRKRDLLQGRIVTCTAGGKRLEGTAMGVDDRGALILRTASGVILVDAGAAHLHTV
ncbi:MAG TPA: biotin--[acetyl-CoA-carboxylase] ligase [Armatimonadota bacterium]|nr:biotin--[acetyl-CoA-carboxylase] ligase [Armatimonadota bacterium]